MVTLKETDGTRRREKGEGRRVMEIGGEWASEVPGGVISDCHLLANSIWTCKVQHKNP